MKTLLLSAALAAFLALSLAGPGAKAGCPSYDPNCNRPCPAGSTC